MAIIKQDLGQLFENNSNFYADTEDNSVVMAINKEKFVKVVTDLLTECVAEKAYNEQSCCICKKKIIFKKEAKYTHGNVVKITFGYGSKHDMDSYYIAICDNCITELEKSGFATK